MVRFDVSLSAASNPVFKLDAGLARASCFSSSSASAASMSRSTENCLALHLSVILFGALDFCGDDWGFHAYRDLTSER